MSVKDLGKHLVLAAALFAAPSCSKTEVEAAARPSLSDCIASTLKGQGNFESHTRQSPNLGLVQSFSASINPLSDRFSGVRVMLLQQVNGPGSLSIIYDPNTDDAATYRGTYVLADKNNLGADVVWSKTEIASVEDRQRPESELAVDDPAAQTLNGIRTCLAAPSPSL